MSDFERAVAARVADTPRRRLRAAIFGNDCTVIAAIIGGVPDDDKEEVYSFATYYAAYAGNSQLCVAFLAKEYEPARAARGGNIELFRTFSSAYSSDSSADALRAFPKIMCKAAHRAACGNHTDIIDIIIDWFKSRGIAIPWHKFLTGAVRRSHLRLFSTLCDRMRADDKRSMSEAMSMLCALDFCVTKGDIPTQERFIEEFSYIKDTDASDWYEILIEMAAYADISSLIYAHAHMPSDLVIDWANMRKFSPIFHNAQVLAQLDVFDAEQKRRIAERARS